MTMTNHKHLNILVPNEVENGSKKVFRSKCYL